MLLTAALAAVAVANPCTDAARLYVCPDLVMRKPYGMRLIRTPGRRLLAATNAIVNVGQGPLEIRARRSSARVERMQTRQVLRPLGPNRVPAVLPPSGHVDFYDTRSRGRYWKYDRAASFTLRAIGADGTVGAIRRTGPKVDYCFRDLRPVERLDGSGRYAFAPRTRQFGACSTTFGAKLLTLGTSVGWADIYPWDYPQNAIDVTGLSGCFLYTLKADPRNELVELDETNNAGAVVVRLPWKGPGARGCATPSEAPGR